MKISIGIIAPSAQVPAVEFALGLERLKAAGFKLRVHPQCRKSHLFFAGTDEERAQAFYDYAIDPSLKVLWCARGGYGAMRILPLLDRMTAERGIPEKKLLVGYSDATALLEYVRSKWGWSVLHGPMPGFRSFSTLTAREWSSLVSFVEGGKPNQPWGRKPLRFAGHAPKTDVQGALVGGNLSVWASLIGTPYGPRAKDRIVFFEDVTEGLYRLDRLVQQIHLGGGFTGARAIILGNFQGCCDTPTRVLAKKPIGKNAVRMLLQPTESELKPLRKALDPTRTIPRIFADVGERLGIPVAYGLPVGHGPDHSSLPLGGMYRLAKSGVFELLDWDWLSA